MGRLFFVISTEHGIGSCEDCSPCVQRGNDARFGDRDRLLLHDFVDGSSVVLVHLVELVDATHAHVCQDQGSCLEREFPRSGVGDDGCSKPYAGTALSRGIDSPRGDIGDMLEELRLGNPWISKKSDINLAPDPKMIFGLYGNPTCHLQQQCLLNTLHSINLRCYAPGQIQIELIILHTRLDI